MKKSYKVGLIGVGLISAVIVGYYFFQEPEDGREGRPVVHDASRTSLVRPSLVARSPTAASGAPAGTSGTSGTAAWAEAASGAPAWNSGVTVQPVGATVLPVVEAGPWAASTQPTAPPQPVTKTAAASTQPVAIKSDPSRTVASVSAATASETTRTYTIKANDTFASIAVAVFGSAEYADEIAYANPLVDPRKLKVGQSIRLPTLKEIEQQRRPAASTTEAAGQTIYVTRPNDTLWSIAVQFYGDGTQWERIYRENRDRIGANPDALGEGLKLRIPPKQGTAP